MAASLLDILNREKALVDQIDKFDYDIEIYKEKIAKLAEEKASVEMKLKSTRSILAHYIEKNLIKYPNNDPSRNPEV